MNKENAFSSPPYLSEYSTKELKNLLAFGELAVFGTRTRYCYCSETKKFPNYPFCRTLSVSEDQARLLPGLILDLGVFNQQFS